MPLTKETSGLFLMYSNAFLEKETQGIFSLNEDQQVFPIPWTANAECIY